MSPFEAALILISIALAVAAIALSVVALLGANRALSAVSPSGETEATHAARGVASVPGSAFMTSHEARKYTHGGDR